MTRRAWWLVGLNILIPGSAQVLAGSRRLGRFGLASTIVLWAIVVIAALLYFLAQPLLLSIGTNLIVLFIAQVGLAFYIVLWVVLTLDTLRLVRLIRTRPSARALIAGLAIVALVAVGGTAGYGVVVTGAARSLLGEVFGGTKMADPIDGRYNLLLLGGDAGKHRVGLRPDSISVVSIDAATGAATVIGIPRNLQRVQFSEDSPLYGPFPNGYDCGPDCLVSYLYTYGEEHPELYPKAEKEHSNPGIEAMRDAIEGVVGLQLQYYVLIDMEGFSDLIDALGGIDIDSTGRYPLGGDEGPNGEPINVDGWIEPGEQHMNGHTALWYARARHGTTDYDRMKRQRQVQEAILTQFDPANVLTKFEAVAKAGAQVVKTDIPKEMLSGFVTLASKTRALDIAKLELSPPEVNVIHPDFDVIHSLVTTTLDASIPTSTPTPEP
jgi:LCP family protein required for cell wall assembly